MRNKVILCVLGSSLLLTAPALRAEHTNSPAGPPSKHQREGLLPPNVVEKLNLTDEQKAKLKAITEKFEKNRDEYVAAHRSEMDAARTAMQDAGNDAEKKKEAREQMGKAMSGLQTERKAAIDELRALLTDEQKKILEESKPKHREAPPKKETPAP